MTTKAVADIELFSFIMAKLYNQVCFVSPATRLRKKFKVSFTRDIDRAVSPSLLELEVKYKLLWNAQHLYQDGRSNNLFQIQQ